MWGSNDRVYYFGCFKGASKPLQVLLNGIEAAIVLTLIMLKQRALNDCARMSHRTWFSRSGDAGFGLTYIRRLLRTFFDPSTSISGFMLGVHEPRLEAIAQRGAHDIGCVCSVRIPATRKT